MIALSSSSCEQIHALAPACRVPQEDAHPRALALSCNMCMEPNDAEPE